jgi:hypothetical protein
MATLTAHTDSQIRATRALLKFCREHQLSEADSAYVQHVERCLHFLEHGDLKQAAEHFRQVPLGGMGCFNDWLPPVVFPHEDGAYVLAVFDALVSQWSRAMRL